MIDYPSVTQVLSPFVDFSQVPDDRLAYATNRGSRVHTYCAAIAQGLFVPNIDEDCRGYVTSFEIWLREMVQKVLFVEEEFIDHDLGYKGHPDLLITLKGNNRNVLIDLKTPISQSKTWKGQIAAYLNLVRKKFSVELGGVLQLKDYPSVTWYNDDARDFNAFLSALTAYRYFK